MVITVTCPSCSSSFPVDPAKIPEGGVNARCSSCAKVFRVEKPAEAEPLPVLEDPTPEPVTRAAPPTVPEPEAEPPTPPESGAEAPARPESEVEPPPLPEPDAESQPDDVSEAEATDEPAGAPAPEADDWVVEHEERPEIEPDPLPPVDDRVPEISGSRGWGSDPFSGEVSRGSGIEDVAEAPEPEAHTLPAPTPPEPEDVDRSGPGSRFEFDDGSEDADARSEGDSDEKSDAEAEREGEAESGADVEVEADTDVEGDASAAADETAEPAEPESTRKPDDAETGASGATPASEVKGFTFGKRDPTDKAKRLARVLVSDMIMYNAERHQSALGAGTLVDDFEEEIQKSWKEYVDQVGPEMANGEGRQFWTDALNDILAKGKKVF